MNNNPKSNHHIETFIQQNSPVNNELIRNKAINDIMHTDIDGRISIIPTEVISRKKSGKKKEVITMCSFSYDEQVNQGIFELRSSNKITAYDIRVHNAICTLYHNGQDTVTLSEIFSVMTGFGRTNPNKNQLMNIENCLRKLGSINVYIDITDELKSEVIRDKQPLIDAGILKNNKDQIKKATINSKMLTYNIGHIESQKGKDFRYIHFTTEPILLTYNKAKKTLITIPIEYIGSINSITNKSIAFQDYLLLRIMNYKIGKMNKNKIKYESIYKNSGVEIPNDKSNRKRNRQCIKQIMNDWISAGLIAAFNETHNGSIIDGIEFEIAG